MKTNKEEFSTSPISSCDLICRGWGQDYRRKNKCSDPCGKDELADNPEVQKNKKTPPFSGAVKSYPTFHSTTWKRRSVQHVRSAEESGSTASLDDLGQLMSVIPVYFPLKELRQGTTTNLTGWSRPTAAPNSHQT